MNVSLLIFFSYICIVKPNMFMKYSDKRDPWFRAILVACEIDRPEDERIDEIYEQWQSQMPDDSLRTCRQAAEDAVAEVREKTDSFRARYGDNAPKALEDYFRMTMSRAYRYLLYDKDAQTTLERITMIQLDTIYPPLINVTDSLQIKGIPGIGPI